MIILMSGELEGLMKGINSVSAASPAVYDHDMITSQSAEFHTKRFKLDGISTSSSPVAMY